MQKSNIKNQNDNAKFKNFISIEFPDNICAVYILYIQARSKEIPFYVGETNSLAERMGNYSKANFTASTDFKVGEAIKYFREKDYKVIVKFKSTEKKKEEQDNIIKDFQRTGLRLLNELRNYKYKLADIEEERQKVREFCDVILKNNFAF